MKLEQVIENEPVTMLARQSRRKRKAVLTFLGSLAIGAIIFITTNNSVAGAILPSIHASLRSLRTDWWTWRADDRPLRAGIGAAFYVATACWHAAATAFGSVLVFVILAKLIGDEPTMDVFMATMLTLISGLGFNHAVFVLATSVSLPILAACCYLLTAWREGVGSLFRKSAFKLKRRWPKKTPDPAYPVARDCIVSRMLGSEPITEQAVCNLLELDVWQSSSAASQSSFRLCRPMPPN